MKLWENAHRMLGNGEDSARLPGNISPVGIRFSASAKKRLHKLRASQLTVTQ
jgi:hypothetical protein